jgi:hypothetical protein
MFGRRSSLLALDRSAGLNQRQVIGLVLVVGLSALALGWIGRANASRRDPSPNITNISSNVSTVKADAVEAGNAICTVSPSFNGMPDMSKQFTLGGTKSRPVIVSLDGVWYTSTPGSEASVMLMIDGKRQSAESELGVVVDARPTGEPQTTEAHGFTFVSDYLTPGAHTAAIQWKDNGVGPYCAGDRTLVIFHK